VQFAAIAAIREGWCGFWRECRFVRFGAGLDHGFPALFLELFQHPANSAVIDMFRRL